MDQRKRNPDRLATEADVVGKMRLCVAKGGFGQVAMAEVNIRPDVNRQKSRGDA